MGLWTPIVERKLASWIGDSDRCVGIGERSAVVEGMKLQMDDEEGDWEWKNG